jgi:hypothetical protein
MYLFKMQCTWNANRFTLYKVHYIKALSLGGDEIKVGGIGAFSRIAKWIFEDLRDRRDRRKYGARWYEIRYE